MRDFLGGLKDEWIYGSKTMVILAVAMILLGVALVVLLTVALVTGQEASTETLHTIQQSTRNMNMINMLMK